MLFCGPGNLFHFQSIALHTAGEAHVCTFQRATAATRHTYRVVSKIITGSRPTGPQGTQGSRFTDALWEMLGFCWRKELGERHYLQTIVWCLQDTRQPSKPISGAGGDIPADTEPKPNRMVSKSGMFSSPSSVSVVGCHYGANKIPQSLGEMTTNSWLRHTILQS